MQPASWVLLGLGAAVLLIIGSVNVVRDYGWEGFIIQAWGAEFAGPLRQVLDRVTDAKARRFLTEKGML